jgi:hypothetical protein
VRHPGSGQRYQLKRAFCASSIARPADIEVRKPPARTSSSSSSSCTDQAFITMSHDASYGGFLHECAGGCNNWHVTSQSHCGGTYCMVRLSVARTRRRLADRPGLSLTGSQEGLCALWQRLPQFALRPADRRLRTADLPWSGRPSVGWELQRWRQWRQPDDEVEHSGRWPQALLKPVLAPPRCYPHLSLYKLNRAYP